MDNFYNEPAPMQQLASLGTSIPEHAVAETVSAVLCIKLGNRYGTCWAAQDDADKLLGTLSPDRWRLYFEECLPGDDAVLSKISEGGRVGKRWLEVFEKCGLGTISQRNPRVQPLIDSSAAGSVEHAATAAGTLYLNLRRARA